MKIKPCIVGLDFGTTSLSAVILRIDNKQIERVFSYETNAYIPSVNPLIKEQSVATLKELFNKLMDEIKSIPDIDIQSYGFTGQMHGIVGLDKNNQAVTNLVTWEDRSGEIVSADGTSMLDKIKKLTGEQTISCGYGIVTLYKWLVVEGRENIVSFCTIADYFAGQLTDKTAMSPTMAHSIGLFDIKSNEWMKDPIEKLGCRLEIFPKIVEEATIVGYVDSIAVVAAIGDNQASFLGSVLDKNSMILNIGTGAQTAIMVNKNDAEMYNKYIDGYETQLRPYDNKHYLIATSFINGGSAYKLLYNFFKESGISLFNLEKINEVQLWENMEMTARKSLGTKDPLEVLPLFSKERNDLGKTGSISNITSCNFNSGNLIISFLTGIAEYYKSKFPLELSPRIEFICGSGNGLKKNKLFTEIIEKTFQKPIYLTPYDEEAAVGAALNAAKAIGLIQNESDNKNFLQNLSIQNN